jgi:adenylyltransferase/sulfurtransferase
VALIGAGGLGCPIGLYLAAAGVGRLGVIDDDVVEVSNLQRQVAHGTSGVGVNKARSLAARIGDLNPHVAVDVFPTRLAAANALDLLRPYDVIVDGTDNFPTRYLANDAAVLLDKPYVYGSVYRFEGQISVFNHQGGPNYRDLFPVPPPPGMVPTCGEAGVLGVVPGIVGTIMATETLKILLGLGTTLSGRLVLFDGIDLQFRELRLERDERVPRPSTLVDYDAFCGITKPGGVRIEAGEAARRLAGGWKPFGLDVRRPAAAARAPLPVVDRVVPHDRLPAELGTIPRDREILVTCRSGVRSAIAVRVLTDAGFSAVVELEGGALAWARAVDPALRV